MNRSKYLFVVLFFIMLVGCGNRVEDEKDVIKDTVQMQNGFETKNDIKQVDNEVPNAMEITANIVSCNDGDISIEYPFISGLGDRKREDKINDLILSEVLSYIQPIDDIDKGQYYKLSYEVKYQDDKILSVVYTGHFFSDTSAYPIDVFSTTNIDLINSKKLKLKEFVIDDSKLLEAYLLVLGEGSDDEIKKFCYDYILQNYNDVAILNRLNQADEMYDFMKPVHSYLTKNSLGISWEVPHVMGDHVEVEIPLDMLKDVLILE